MAVFNNWDGLTTVLDPGSTNRLNNYLMKLNDGVYTIRFVNEGSQPVAIDWVLKIARLDWEKILNNGVGQTSALSLGFSSSPSGDSGNSSTASVPSLQTSFRIRAHKRFGGINRAGPDEPPRDAQYGLDRATHYRKPELDGGRA